MFEIINSIIMNNLSDNPEFIYALLQRQELFKNFRLESQFSDLVENLDIMFTFFLSRFSMDDELTPDHVLQIITKSLLDWNPHKLVVCSHINFRNSLNQSLNIKKKKNMQHSSFRMCGV